MPNLSDLSTGEKFDAFFRQLLAFARALADLLNLFTLGFSYLVVAASSRKRGIHDRIANTLHVYALSEPNGGPELYGRSC